MKSSVLQLGVSVLSAFLLGCAPQSSRPNTPDAPTKVAVKAQAPTPEQMEAAFKKMSATTDEHKILSGLAGTWSAEVKMWMAPDAPPQVSKGRSTASMVLDGKFLKEDFTGTFMGKPFKGTGYTGFDTVAHQFASVWMDSVSTGIMTTTGSLDSSSKAITFEGTVSCPLTEDHSKKLRSVLHVQDKNHHTFEMYDLEADGSSHKSMEISYTRAK
jgi:hypothetical protein